MEFEIRKGVSVIGYTNPNGERGYYPTYHINIDSSYIADEFRRYNVTPSMVEDAIANASNEISFAINRAISKRVSQVILAFSHHRVRAKVNFEVDYRVCCETVDKSYFDCAIVLDDYKLSELPPDADGFDHGFCNFGDDIYHDAVSYGLVDEWDGPFTFYIVDGIAYDRYIAARVRDEYGYELRG